MLMKVHIKSWGNYLGTTLCQWIDRFAFPTLKLEVRGERGLHSTSSVNQCFRKAGCVYIHLQTVVRHLPGCSSTT